MNGEHRGELLTLGPDKYCLSGSFAPNGSSDPASTSSRGRRFGFTFTVTYAATGVYTVTFPSNMSFPNQVEAVILTPQVDAVANWFDLVAVGETTLNTTTRQLVIQAHRAGTPREVAAAAGSRINFAIYASNTTGA